eukprot:51578-Eustigmatos_ZCMA.PRE.1
MNKHAEWRPNGYTTHQPAGHPGIVRVRCRCPMMAAIACCRGTRPEVPRMFVRSCVSRPWNMGMEAR